MPDEHVVVAVGVEVDHADPPAGQPLPERRNAEGGAPVDERPGVGRLGLVQGVALLTHVGHEQLGHAVTVEVAGRRPHARPVVVDAHGRGHVDEAWVPGGRVVAIQPIGVGVVGDQQVPVAVVVDVDERRAQAVAGAVDVQPGLAADVDEAGPSPLPRAEVVQQQVGDGCVAAREPP